MNSCIYEGKIRHRRFAPVENSFNYRLFMMYLDLSELPNLFDGHPLWSADRFNLAQFRRRDHLGASSADLADSVRGRVEEQVGRRPAGPIRLLTHLRYFGHRFNPVSFFFCFDAAGQEVETVVAEVNNTPWNEQHTYVLPESLNTGRADKKHYRFAKDFHVSPFMGMAQVYNWHFTAPRGRMAVHMVSSEGGRRLFDATLTMRRTEIDGPALTRVLCQYPLMTARVVGAIYWQAARLYLKKCPTFTHPKWLKKETAE